MPIFVLKRGGILSELRKDYILDRYVLIVEKRGLRPKQFKEEDTHDKEATDYFAVGNEELTPPEIGRIEDENGWKLRWFPNKFAAVHDQGNSVIKTDNEFFTFSGNYGHHEVLVETPDDRQMWDLPIEHLQDVFDVYGQRIKALHEDPAIDYVSVFKNHGKKGGTSLIHSHSQIIAVNFLPTVIKEKVEAVKHHAECPYCKIAAVESKSERACFENEAFVAFTPYASRFNYEIWVLPKEHKQKYSELNVEALAKIMHQILIKLKDLNTDYNFFIHYAPHGEDLHLAIEVTPRIATWAGFELGTGATINSVPPEFAAKFYRGEIKVE